MGDTIGVNNNNDNIKTLRRIREYIDKGEFESAERRAKRVIRAENRGIRSGLGKSYFFKEAHNSLCVSLTGQVNIEEAMQACNQSLEHSPKHWESLKSRAILYYMTKDFPKSLEDFTSALKNAPNNEAIRAALSQNISVVKSK
ncbi:MAG: hypothetical protein HOH18_06585 [Kordiimonadaceae bacterium]|nr:hypothetical protein [Kordiimonadaceae bacterium]